MTVIRLSPSGSPILNSGGAPLEFGPGARLRLTEATVTLGGSTLIPTVTTDSSIVKTDGFTGTAPIILTLDNPKEGLSYRAQVHCDLSNASSVDLGDVDFYLDASVDGGTTWTLIGSNSHLINSNGGIGIEARMASFFVPLLLGSVLGVDESIPSPSLKLRCRMAQNGTAVAEVFSDPNSSPPTGAFHMELEECF